MFEGVVFGLSIATHYGTSRTNAPNHKLSTYPRNLFMMVPWWDYTSKQDLEPNCPFRWISSPFELRMRIVNSAWQKTSSLGGGGGFVDSLPQNPLGSPLDGNLANFLLRASHSKVIYWYGTFLPTLSKSERIHCNLEGTHDSHMGSPRSLPPWSVPRTSSIRFTLCISCSVGHHVAPCLWRWLSWTRLCPIASLVNHPWVFIDP
jgi:hypothetical protein